MNHSLPSPKPTPSYRRHRRQFAWQILVPMLVFGLLALGAAAFLSWGGTNPTRHLADVALIWLVAPLLLAALVIAALAGALVYLMARLLKKTPVYTGKGQEIFCRAASFVNSLADKIVIPIIKVNQFLAILQALKRK